MWDKLLENDYSDSIRRKIEGVRDAGQTFAELWDAMANIDIMFDMLDVAGITLTYAQETAMRAYLDKMYTSFEEPNLSGVPASFFIIPSKDIRLYASELCFGAAMAGSIFEHAHNFRRAHNLMCVELRRIVGNPFMGVT